MASKRQRDSSPVKAAAASSSAGSPNTSSAVTDKQKSVSSFFNKKPKTETKKAATKDDTDNKDDTATTTTTAAIGDAITAVSLGLEVREVKDQATFIASIRRLSSRLMGRVQLSVNGNRYRLIEIEYYYNAPDINHVDSFAHGSKLQKDTCGSWYFHRQGGGTYKAGTYKGLDLTFGVAGGPHGGILIRAIQKIGGGDDKKKGAKAGKGQLIEGPCNVVNHILTTCGYDHNNGVGQLADNMSLDAFDTSSPLHFVTATNPVDAPVVASARVGLTLKVSSVERGRYIMQPYRHIARDTASSIAKFKVTIVLGLLSAGESLANISTWTGVKGAKLTQWVKLFNDAKAKAAKPATATPDDDDDDSKDDDKDDNEEEDEENDDDDDDSDKKKKKAKKPAKKAAAKKKGGKKGKSGEPLSFWYAKKLNNEDLAGLYGAWQHHYKL